MSQGCERFCWFVVGFIVAAFVFVGLSEVAHAVTKPKARTQIKFGDEYPLTENISMPTSTISADASVVTSASAEKLYATGTTTAIQSLGDIQLADGKGLINPAGDLTFKLDDTGSHFDFVGGDVAFDSNKSIYSTAGYLILQGASTLYLRVAGGDLVLGDTGGKIGMATSTVAYPLVIASRAAPSGLWGTLGIDSGVSGGDTGMMFLNGGVPDWAFYNDLGNNYLSLIAYSGAWQGSSVQFNKDGEVYFPSGNIGVATSTPGYLGSFQGTVGCSALTEYSLTRIKDGIEYDRPGMVLGAEQRIMGVSMASYYMRHDEPQLANFEDEWGEEVYDVTKTEMQLVEVVVGSVTDELGSTHDITDWVGQPLDVVTEATRSTVIRSATDQWQAKHDTWARLKDHPRFTRRQVGLVADDPRTPDEYKSWDDYGNLQGILPSKVLADLVLFAQDQAREIKYLKRRDQEQQAQIDQGKVERADLLARIEKLEARVP